MSLSRTLRKIAGIGAIALGAFITIISGGYGAPLGLKVALIGAALLSSLKRPKLPVTTGFGTELQLSGDPSEVRKIIYGEAWTAGALRFRQSTGVDNKDLYMVIVLAGHECDSVTAVEADRETLTLDGSGNVTSPSKWVGLMNVRFLMGTDGQTADSTLDSTFTEITSNHRWRGCTIAIVKLTFDETNLASPPPFRFKVKGRKVYDPRLDSTNGGSGSHRLATPSTWAWSQNVVLCANDFLRGVSVNSIYIAGLGLASTRFVWSNVAAEADICDQSVTLVSSDTQKRYTANGVIDPRQPPGEILRHFEMAFAGDIIPSDGYWRFFAGAYRTPTLLLEPKHFIGPLRHVVHKGEMDRYDTATGQYASQAESGTAIDYAPISLSTVTVGSERVLPLSFQLVNDGTNSAGVYDGGARAQRIAKLLLEKEAAGKNITCTTSLYGLRAMPGETIQITHAAFGLTAQDMRVLDVTLRMVQDGDKAYLVVDLTLEAGPSSLYTWSADETVIDASPTLAQAQVPFPKPGVGWAPDSQGKPAGVRQTATIGTASRAQLSLVDDNLRIASTPVTNVAFGLPAVPVNDGLVYQVTLRHNSTAASVDGLYIRMEEYSGSLPSGKTHIGTFGSGDAETVVQERTSFVDLVSNGPFPSDVQETFDYTPTGGTNFVTLAFYNWNPTTAGASYVVRSAGMTVKGLEIDVLPNVLSLVQTYGLIPGSVNINSVATESVAGASETSHRMRAESAFTPAVDCEVQVIGVMDQESSFDGDSGTSVFVAILPTANIATGLGFDQLPALLTGVQFGAGGRIQAGTRTSMVSQGIFAVTAGVPYTACIANIHGVGTVKFWDLQLTVQQVQR